MPVFTLPLRLPGPHRSSRVLTTPSVAHQWLTASVLRVGGQALCPLSRGPSSGWPSCITSSSPMAGSRASGPKSPLLIFDAANSYMDTVLSGLPKEALAVSSSSSMGAFRQPVRPVPGFSSMSSRRSRTTCWKDEGTVEETEDAHPEYLDIASLRTRATKPTPAPWNQMADPGEPRRRAGHTMRYSISSSSATAMRGLNCETGIKGTTGDAGVDPNVAGSQVARPPGGAAAELSD